MNSIRKVTGLVARVALGLAVLAGVLFLIAKSGSESKPIGAQSQSHRRIIMRRPWPVEPVKVISAKTKKKEKVDIGREFDDDDDWLDGFTVTVRNGSDKIVTALTIDVVFPREPGDTRNKFVAQLGFGPRPDTPESIHRNPNKIVKPGETIDLEVRPQSYDHIKSVLQRLGYPNSIDRVELSVSEVGFEDGSVLISGTLWVQDPDNPNDPTKKVRPSS